MGYLSTPEQVTPKQNVRCSQTSTHLRIYTYPGYQQVGIKNVNGLLVPGRKDFNKF